MTPPTPTTRRRFLHLGATGLATSLAGCSDTCTPLDNFCGPTPTPQPHSDPSAPDNDTDDDEPVNKRPSYPVASFKSSDTTVSYTFYHLSPFKKPRTDLTNTDDGYYHIDDETFHITVTENRADLTINYMKLRRPLKLTLHVRTASRRFRTVTTELTPKKDGGDDGYNDYTTSFDLSALSLPRDAGGYVELVGEDAATNVARQLKRHQYIGIKHDGGTKWLNREEANVHHHTASGTRYRRPPDSSDVGYIDHIDTDTHRTVFIAGRSNHNGELIGVSTKVKHKPYNRYLSASTYWKRRHSVRYETHFADHISHINELGRKIKQAQTALGITGRFQRLQTLTDLIQQIPYGSSRYGGYNVPPTVALYEKQGNCSEKTLTIASILRSKPWNTTDNNDTPDIRTSAIACYIDGQAHFVLGIDERDIGNPTHDIFYVSPDKNEHRLPDTKYAFVELTSDTKIGEFSESLYEVEFIRDKTDFNHFKSEYDQTPPNY